MSKHQKKEKKPDTVSMIVVFSFYAVIIILSTILGYTEGQKNNTIILGLTAGFCLSVVFCIILWITVGQKMTKFCIQS
jgi:quinol-cytochrome oxidoreductase complex cytochrome b subunit